MWTSSLEKIWKFVSKIIKILILINKRENHPKNIYLPNNEHIPKRKNWLHTTGHYLYKGYKNQNITSRYL